MKSLICIAAAAAVLVVTGAASAAQPITAQPLAAARLAKPFSFTVAKPGDLAVVRVTVQPGGDFGWHSHRSPVAVAVLAGTLTLYDSSDKSCRPRPVSAGQGFVEQPHHVHLARNDGSVPVKVLVVYLGAPHGVSPDVPAAQPAQCAAVE